jgi:type IV pilus biogenesis protein CpaD/CtpE
MTEPSVTNYVLHILAFAALSACAKPPPSSDAPNPLGDFGLAIKTNMAAQIIADEGEVRTLGPAPGERRALAVGRYQTDRVEKPAEVYTRDE